MSDPAKRPAPADAPASEAKRQREEGHGDEVVPCKPEPFLKSSQSAEFEAGMQMVMEELAEEGERREAIQKPCRNLRNVIEASIRMLHNGENCELAKARADVDAFLATLTGPAESFRVYNNVSNMLSALVAAEGLQHFLATGKLIRKGGNFDSLTTNEYLLGVVRLSDEVESYAVGRAMWQDTASVALCSRFMNAVLVAFMEFNLRNGNLRRRYDSIKYRVKKLENILFELSLIVGTSEIERVEAGAAGGSPLDQEEMLQFGKDIDEASEVRNQVIIASRDPQKDSKHAIFALHRGNLEEARAKLEKTRAACVKIAESSTMPVGELHGGSFGNALEEYAEARIFEEWLTNDGALMPFSRLREEIGLTATGYIGGLVDFTGELGRFGVAQATKRNVDAVKKALSSMLAVHEFAVQLQEIVSGRSTKKLDAVAVNTKKLESVLYESILVTRTNRRAMDLSSMEEAPKEGSRSGEAE